MLRVLAHTAPSCVRIAKMHGVGTITWRAALSVARAPVRLAPRRTMAKSAADYERYITELSRSRKPSPIRALQPLVKLPGMISLGGGMPNPNTFPFDKMSFTIKADPSRPIELSGADLETALQYSPTPGLPGLVDVLAQLQSKEHKPPLGAASLSICLSTGSQDALSKAFEMCVAKEDSLLVEVPTYSGSLAHLVPLGCRLVGVQTDENGLRPDSLDATLRSWIEQRDGKRPRVLYVIPTGANPSGGTLSVERRRQLYEIARRPENDLLIIEDDPYYYLQLGTGARFPSLLSMDTDGRVLRFDSFSKILSSGLRVGWVTGPKPLVERIEMHMQSTSLHPSGLSQAVVLSLLRRWKEEGDGFERHVASVCDFYRRQRDAFLASAERHLTGLAEWNRPSAGMFVWIRLLGIEDSQTLIQSRAVEKKVLLVPGVAFMPDGAKNPYVRAAYSTATPEEMDEALKRLAALLKDERARR